MKRNIRKSISLAIAILLLCTAIPSSLADGNTLTCKYCGRSIPADSNYCPYCGKLVDNTASEVLTLPEYLEVIQEEAFANTDNLDQVIAKDKLKRIESKAFAESSIKRITLPESVTFIADNAFYKCKDVLFKVKTGSYAYEWAVNHSFRTIDPNSAALDTPISLIFASSASSSDCHGKAMTVFANKVKELSGGSVTCDVYADSTLFSSTEEWDAINTGGKNGGADITYITFETLSSKPNLAWCEMINTACFWNNYNHMSTTLNGEAGQQIFDIIAESTNIFPLNAFYLGSRVIHTRNRAINSYTDMNGLLIRMPGSEAWQNLGRALGADPTPLAFSELYTALQTGAIDGHENPLSPIWNAGFYEVAKYIAITNHVVDSILPCINTATWNSMTEAQQTAVKVAMDFARDYNDGERINQENNFVAALEGVGCTITYPDFAGFKTNASRWYSEHPEVTGNWDMDIYSLLQ